MSRGYVRGAFVAGECAKEGTQEVHCTNQKSLNAPNKEEGDEELRKRSFCKHGSVCESSERIHDPREGNASKNVGRHGGDNHYGRVQVVISLPRAWYPDFRKPTYSWSVLGTFSIAAG